MSNNKFIARNGLIAAGFVYPTTDGSSGQVLVTDGSKNLSFTSVGGTVSGAANINSTGVGVYDSTASGVLDFRGVTAASSKLSVALNATNNSIDIDFVPANVVITTLSGAGDMSTKTAANYSTTAAGDIRYLLATAAGANSGIATLDSGGKVPTSQLPSSVLGAVHYQGTWNATTNSPSLASSTGTQGFYYIVSTAGTTSLDGTALWAVGDWAVYSGSAWERVEGSNAVASVFGRTGTVVASGGDYTAAQITNTPPSGMVGTATTLQLAVNALQSSKLALVSGDTSPQLGGNLDVQANTITTTTTNGSIVLVPNGTGGLKVGSGTGTTLLFGVPGSATIADNTSSATTLLSYTAATFKNVRIEYSAEKNANTDYGQLAIWTDGTNIDMAQFGGSFGTGTTGVVLSASISGGAVNIQYTSTSTGGSGTFRFAATSF